MTPVVRIIKSGHFYPTRPSDTPEYLRTEQNQKYRKISMMIEKLDIQAIPFELKTDEFAEIAAISTFLYLLDGYGLIPPFCFIDHS